MVKASREVLWASANQNGFSLAEVLIALGVIGVVVVLTVSTLITNVQKNQTVTQLQKVYSEMSQVLLNSTAENGFPNTWDWGTTYDSDNNKRFIETYFLPYISAQQNCEFTTTGACTRIAKKYLDEKTAFSLAGNRYLIILGDGKQLYLTLDGGTTPTYFMIYVDLNGNKKPNIVGKDIFLIYYYKTLTKPFFWGQGSDRDTILNNSYYGCNEAATSQGGLFCGALIQYDGWQIKSDYPW
ncbi:MAG: DUF6613 domain-containing protein [Candidatus Gastranaerophilaceae bacterium]